MNEYILETEQNMDALYKRLIRCADCIYFEENWEGVPGCTRRSKSVPDFMTRIDYCSRAEAKKEKPKQ